MKQNADIMDETIKNDDFLRYLLTIRTVYKNELKFDFKNHCIGSIKNAYNNGAWDVVSAITDNYIKYLQGKENNENE